jgi:AraC-like DNA-binding protein
MTAISRATAARATARCATIRSLCSEGPSHTPEARVAARSAASGSETNSTTSLRVVIAALAKYGVNLDDELTRVGLTLRDTQAVDGRVPRTAYCSLWARIAEVSRDPDCGLALARTQAIGTMGVLEYVAISASTVREGCERLARYGRLLHDGGIHEFRVERRGACLAYHMGVVPPTRAQIDWSFAYILWRARAGTGLPIEPLEFRVHYPRPASTEALASVFRCPIVFDQSAVELWLPIEVLEQRLERADPQLAALMTGFAERELARLPSGGPFLSRLHQAITSRLGNGGQPRLSDVAQAMSMSTRSLQRWLGEEGMSFTAVVSQVRLSLAAGHLVENKLAISEIAFLLGYSSLSAFHRAFKRAHGCTPAAYRQARSG